MKYYYCFGRFMAFWLLTSTLFAQADKNFILARTYKNGNPAEAGDVAKTTTQVQYFDGLGRPLQSIAVGQSPTGNDIISHQQYDAFGREPKQFLPFTNTGATGALRPDAAALQNDFYSNNVPDFAPADLSRPFVETTFEASPLNRVLTQRAAGNNSNWSELSYLLNSGTAGELAVKRYVFQESANLTQTIAANGYYADGQLTLLKSTDENGKLMLEAKDKEGRVLLKRALVAGSTYADTYYVYDDLGQLRAVLQPMYQSEPSTTKFAFLYRYDNRGRLTEKQVPGAERVEMRYDQYERLVLNRDGNQRARGVWSFIKYDQYNRPIVTGEIANAPDETALMSNGHHETFDGAGQVKYSLNATQPNVTEAQVLIVTYYDNYTNWGALDYQNQYGLATNPTVVGQTTGGRTRMLHPDGSYGAFLTHTIYYDDNYRPIQTVKQIFGFMGQNDSKLRHSTQYKYAVAAVVFKEKEQQGTSSSVVSVEKEYSYDHADRLLRVQHQITRDGNPQPQVTIAAMDYNELGQLKAKWLHSIDGTNYRRQTNYSYNIRGWQTEGKTWMKKQDSATPQNQFSYTLAYDQPNAKYTNGNISNMSWNGISPLTTGGAYSFSYDGLNRLLAANGAANEEKGLTYDLNGNIKTLQRTGLLTPGGGMGLIDNLVYDYPDGNRLNDIQDASGNADGFKQAPPSGAGGAYAYDANGNLIKDANKGIAQGALEYNLLNLVRKITLNANALEYYYDAAGQKHQLIYSKPSDPTQNETTRYVGSMEWLGNNLKRIATGEGQYIYTATQTGLQGQYQYNIDDHLSNVRLVITDSGKVLQRNDYYAFGLPIPILPSTSDSLRLANKYLFLDRELQPETGYFDLKLRQYDPAKARFDNVDSKPDDGDQESLSTYQYGWNNPILRSDPNGDCPGCGQQIISWLIGGYYKYVQGGLDYARNEARHNTRSEYTERVPEQTRNINHAIGKVKAIQKSVEGATQIIESHMTFMGTLEGGAIGAVSSVVSAMVKPQGLSSSQFGQLSQMLKDKVGGIGDDIFVQGSRASGTAKKTSDIDIGISVSEDKFRELIKTYFGNPNQGSAKEKTMLHAIQTGKIQAGEAKLSQFRKQVENFLGIETDISIIRQGSAFDKGSKIYVK